ncbi:hypothetical protein MUK42_06234 [Musa troglodytarum]|uniref:Uncharacterized protein n=1 Tax=Musa troglodytarum TaxID=320322 RepID=A0A9E7L813_9LILI|nr:hypothetical protein MUK42_06234 [Musa troglodytarum]
MTLLCFLLDLRTISPPLLRDLKQLKIAYRPGERFSVCGFHHAVNSISSDNFLPDVSKFIHTESSTEEMPLTDLLNKNALYKWGSDDVPKKVIVICSSIATSTESLRISLLDAAERCITVEFVVLEQADTNLCYEDALKLMQFSDGICDLENCVIRSYPLGLIMGSSFFVTPSTHEIESASDESDKVDLNVQIFRGLCRTLVLLDQGLVCSSTCNTETMQDGTFLSYYLLQPSAGGPMLLRRLASSEEMLPIPEIAQTSEVAIPEEVENSIRASLRKVELRDYNPLQHERGFHAKLNWLVKESLQFGSITSLCVPANPELNLNDLQQQPLTQVSEGQMSLNQHKEKTSSCLTEEWERLLIVDELTSSSPPSFPTPRIKTSNLRTQAKTLDEKTSRILERLEAPKQQNSRAALSSIPMNFLNEEMKRPLLPFNSSSSQPLKPNFQKLKRKQR